MEPVTFMLWILVIAIISASIYAVESKDLLSAAIASGVAGLVASLVYLILQAPDVAITEASIGAGITLAVFVYAIKRTRRYEA